MTLRMRQPKTECNFEGLTDTDGEERAWHGQ